MSICQFGELYHKMILTQHHTLGLEKSAIANNNSNVVISQFNEGSFNITLGQSDFLALKELLESKKG